MKRINHTINLALLMLIGHLAIAQQTDVQEFTMPLTNPDAPGKLAVDLHHGGVTITGYSEKEVLVTMKTYREEEEKAPSREGLKRIPNMGAAFEIVEDNNVVAISGDRHHKTDFTIQVPREFSLIIKTHHDGEVQISDVSGEIVVDAHHGGMELENVSGSVVADTHHGDIIVTFDAVSPNVPMAFSTYHGDVDITFPSSINASAKMKSERGDIYTDFEMKLNASQPQLKKSEDGKQKIAIMEWVRSEIGSGGPEYMFTTHHGDIILRKK